MFTTDNANKTFEEMKRQLRDTPAVLRDVGLEFDQLRAKLAALQTLSPSANVFGVSPLEAAQRVIAINQAVDAMDKKLRSIGMPEDQIQATLNALRQILQQIDVATDESDKLKTHLDELKSIFSSMFDGIGKGLADAFTNGTIKLKTFRDLLKDTVNQLVQFILQVTILEPLKGVLGGFLNATFTGSSILGAKGLVLAGTGRPLLMGHGGVLSKPTLLAGGSAIASERGQYEGVLPLKRSRTGDLGVVASGMGNNVQVNIYNNTDSKVDTQQRRTSNGGVAIDVMISKAVAKNIRENGETYRAIRDTFGLRPQVAAR